MGRNPQPDTTVGRSDLLENQSVFDVTERRASEFLRDDDPQQAQFGQLGEHLARKVLTFVPVNRVGCDLAPGEFTNHVPDRQLVLVEFEVHRPPLVSRGHCTGDQRRRPPPLSSRVREHSTHPSLSSRPRERSTHPSLSSRVRERSDRIEGPLPGTPLFTPSLPLTPTP